MKFFRFYVIKLIALIAVNSFLLTSVYGQAINAFVQSARETDKIRQTLSNFTLPFSYGKITSSNFSPSDTVIINIQDLHSHPDVQKNIAKIIEIFDKKYGVKNIYLEGAYGQIDTSWLLDIGGDNIKDPALLSMIDCGRLTGAEYYSVSSERFTVIKGLENKKDYLENLKRFAKILESQNEIKRLLHSASSDIEFVKEAYYNRAQKKLDKLSKQYAGNKLSAKKYFNILHKYADKLNIDFYKYDNINLYMFMSENEKRLNYKKIIKELNLFLSELKESLPYGLYVSLMENTDNFSDTDKLCVYLAGIINDYGLDISAKYLNLDGFLQYTQASREINPIELLKEEQELFEEINESFYTDISAKEAAFLVNFYGYLNNFLSSKLTADDYTYYKTNKSLFKTLWAKYVGNEKLLALEKYENLAEMFYVVNEERNKYFLDNIDGLDQVQKIESASFDSDDETENIINSLKFAKNIYIVITGGFHTQALSEEFTKKGISNMVITPNVSDGLQFATETYHRIAKEQSKALFNALATLPLSLNPEEIKMIVLASSVSSIKEANEILTKQIEKAKLENTSNGLESAIIEEGKDGTVFLKITINSKNITYTYDKQIKEFINPVTQSTDAAGIKKSSLSRFTKPFDTKFIRKLFLTIIIGLFSFNSLSAGFDNSNLDFNKVVQRHQIHFSSTQQDKSESDSTNHRTYRTLSAADSLNIVNADLNLRDIIEESSFEEAPLQTADNVSAHEELPSGIDVLSPEEVQVQTSDNLSTYEGSPSGIDIPSQSVGGAVENVRDILSSYPQIQNIAGLGEVLVLQYGSETASEILAKLDAYNNYSYKVRQSLYLLNSFNAQSNFGSAFRNNAPVASILSSINQILTIAETDAVRKASLELKERLNYLLPDGDVWKEKLPENNDELFAFMAQYGNDPKRALDHILFSSIYEDGFLKQYLPANFYLSDGLRNMFFTEFESQKQFSPSLSFGEYLNEALQKHKRAVIIDAVKQYKENKKLHYHDYVETAKLLLSLPAAYYDYTSVQELSIDKPIMYGAETTVYVPYVSALNKEGSVEAKALSKIRRLRGAYSNGEVKNLVTSLNKTEKEYTFYSESDEEFALRSAHKVLASVALSETANEELKVTQISENLEKKIFKKFYSPDIDTQTWVKQTVQENKSDIYLNVLEQKLKEKDGKDGKQLLNSEEYFLELENLLSNFKGFEIKFNFYSIEEMQEIFKEARDLIKNKDSLIGRSDLKALKRMAKENLGSKSKYFPKDKGLLTELKNNNYDVQKTFYALTDSIFFMEPAEDPDGKTVGWSWGLKENQQRLEWGKNPETGGWNDMWTKGDSVQTSFQLLLNSVLNSAALYLPDDFKLSDAMNFTIRHDFCTTEYKGDIETVHAQMSAKYKKLIFADALMQETQRHKTENKEIYDFSKMEKILEGAVLASDKTYSNSENRQSVRHINSNLPVAKAAQKDNTAYFESITNGVLKQIGIPHGTNLSKEVRADISGYLSQNKNLSRYELSKKLRNDYEKTILADMLMQYKDGKKLKFSDWIPFAASMLPQIGFVSKNSQDKTFEFSGSGSLQIGVAGIPELSNGFGMALSMGFLSGHLSPSQKIAKSFAKNKYAASDLTRDYLLSRYAAASDGKIYVYEQKQIDELFDWINAKEQKLVKEGLRKSYSEEFKQYGISKLSKTLENKIFDNYRTMSVYDRNGRIKEIRQTYSNDIEIGVLDNLVSRARKNKSKASGFNTQQQAKDYANYENLHLGAPSGQTIQNLQEEENAYIKIKELSAKLAAAETSFVLYDSENVQKILKKANNFIKDKEKADARINSIIVEVLSSKLSYYLADFKEYVFPQEIKYVMTGYYNENKDTVLSDEQWAEQISALFARDIILNAFAQYKDIRTLQLGEVIPTAVKTSLKFMPFTHAGEMLYAAAEAASGGQSAERKFMNDLKATGYESYDEIKNKLIEGLNDFSSSKYRLYKEKDEKKINKWINANEKKLIISHFNDKLFADFGILKLSDRELEKDIFKNYEYSPYLNKKHVLLSIFKNHADEIYADLIKQKPQDKEQFDAAKQLWSSFDLNFLKPVLPSRKSEPETKTKIAVSHTDNLPDAAQIRLSENEKTKAINGIIGELSYFLPKRYSGPAQYDILRRDILQNYSATNTWAKNAALNFGTRIFEDALSQELEADTHDLLEIEKLVAALTFGYEHNKTILNASQTALLNEGNALIERLLFSADHQLNDQITENIVAALKNALLSQDGNLFDGYSASIVIRSKIRVEYAKDHLSSVLSQTTFNVKDWINAIAPICETDILTDILRQELIKQSPDLAKIKKLAKYLQDGNVIIYKDAVKEILLKQAKNLIDPNHIAGETADEETKDKILDRAQDFINSADINSQTEMFKPRQLKPSKNVSDISKWIELTGFIDLFYHNEDYGLYALLSSKGMFWLSRSQDGKIVANTKASTAFDAMLNVKKFGEKIAGAKSKKSEIDASTHLNQTYEELIKLGYTNVIFHEGGESGGYFTFIYSYLGQTLGNYKVYPFKNGGSTVDRNAVSKAKTAVAIFRWFIDEGYRPRYVNDPEADRSEYFIFVNNIKLYLYTPLGDRPVIRGGNALYYDLQRETERAITLERYKNSITRYYNQRGYGSKLAEAATFGNNILIEETYFGNLLYWIMPDGAELYPVNYDGSIVPFEELIASVEYGALDKAASHKQLIENKRIDLRDNSVFYYDTDGNFKGTKEKEGLTGYEINAFNEDGQLIDKRQFITAVLNTGKIKKLAADYQKAHPETVIEEGSAEDSKILLIAGGVKVDPLKDDETVMSLNEFENTVNAATEKETPAVWLADKGKNVSPKSADDKEIYAAANTADDPSEIKKTPQTENEILAQNENISKAEDDKAENPSASVTQTHTDSPVEEMKPDPDNTDIISKIKDLYNSNKILFIAVFFLGIWFPVWIFAKIVAAKKKNSKNGSSGGIVKFSAFPIIEIVRWMFADIIALFKTQKNDVQTQDKTALLQENHLAVSKTTLNMSVIDIETVINRLAQESLDGVNVPVKVIKSILENENWLSQTKKILEANGISPDIKNIIKLPQSALAVRKTFDAITPAGSALKWVETNIDPHKRNKSADSQLYLFIGNNYAEADLLHSQGLKTALIQRVDFKPKKHKKLSPRAPNTIVPVEYNGKTYEFIAEHYISSDIASFEKSVSIKAAVLGVTAQYQDDFDKLPQEIQKSLSDKAYDLSHKYFATNIENNVKYMQHILGVTGVGAVFYDGDIPASDTQKSPFLEISNNAAKKYFDAQGAGDLLGDISAGKEHYKKTFMKPYKYSLSLNADKSRTLLDKNKTAKLVKNEIEKNVSIIKIKSKNAVKTVEELWQKNINGKPIEENEDMLKMQNLLDFSKEIKNILVLAPKDINEELLQKVYELGFGGIYVLRAKNENIEDKIEIINKISKGYDAQNFIELYPQDATMFKERLENAGIFPVIKIEKGANAQTIVFALEGLENAAVEINSIQTGDELSLSQNKISTVFLKNTAGISKDISNIRNLKQNKALKVYNAALEIARKSDFLPEEITDPKALEPYASADNFENKDFASMKAALKAAGLSGENMLVKYAETSEDSVEGYAAAKAYIKAAIEKYYEFNENEKQRKLTEEKPSIQKVLPSLSNIIFKKIKLPLTEAAIAAALSAVFGIIITIFTGESLGADILSKVILPVMAISYAFTFITSFIYKTRQNANMFKKEQFDLNQTHKILRAA
ncbi:MAG: hypothetical protein LBL00_01970 [Endomicrobium sp.]|jgi:hypothetical protein|nr:hypothetical protein [Endomicrobium sp.]